MTNQEINNIFGITESYQLPDRLMKILKDEYLRVELFRKFEGIDLSHDLFTQYFQEQHSNRESMMQDFTPPELCDVVVNSLGDYTNCLDVCSGTGGLTIAAWKKNPNAFYYAEELSERAFPILLFNLALRNIKGYVINKDVLSGKFLKGFRLQKGEKYSEFEEVFCEPPLPKFEAVIMNPPYSLKHVWDMRQKDIRFEGYDYPPTKAADYAFVLDGLYNMSKDGSLVAILPHGVLFRGNSEEKIRTSLVKNGLLNEIIGLPDKLFLNTQIPVCVMILRRNSEDVLFVDASREFEKNAKINRLRVEDVEKIMMTSERRLSINKYAEVVSFRRIEENNYNLNIPRYVDTYEEPEPIDLDSVLDEIDKLNNEIAKTDKKLVEMLKELNGSPEDMKLVRKTIKTLGKKTKGEDIHGQMSMFDFLGGS